MKLGFIGLGDMGQAIVPRLLAAGHQVAGWNRTKDKAEPLFKLGMTWADSPKQLAAESEVVFTIVTNSDAVKSIALGENGISSGLRKGSIYLDMSTIDPESSRAVGAAFFKAGLIMMDAPISGTTLTIGKGNASVMVGGDKAAFDRVQPVLLAIGPGEAGSFSRGGPNGRMPATWRSARSRTVDPHSSPSWTASSSRSARWPSCATIRCGHEVCVTPHPSWSPYLRLVIWLDHSRFPAVGFQRREAIR